MCKHYDFIGSRRQGSFAEYVVVPVDNVVKVADSVTYEQAAMFEPSTVALHGLRCNHFVGGKTVAILGAGTIGIFTMQWVNLFGAKKVVVFDIVKERLELAEKLGASQTVNLSKDDSLSPNERYEYVFETAGTSETIKLAFQLCSDKSNVCCVGTPIREVSFSAAEWEVLNRKEFSLTASWMSYSAPFPGEEWSLTAEMFDKKKLVIEDTMIFGRYPIAKVREAFRLFEDKGKVKGKILLVNDWAL